MDPSNIVYNAVYFQENNLGKTRVFLCESHRKKIRSALPPSGAHAQTSSAASSWVTWEHTIGTEQVLKELGHSLEQLYVFHFLGKLRYKTENQNKTNKKRLQPLCVHV